MLALVVYLVHFVHSQVLCGELIMYGQLEKLPMLIRFIHIEIAIVVITL